MNFKIDTKEKFTVITPELSVFDAKIAADLWKTATSCMNTAPGNVIMNFQNVATANGAAVNDLSSLHQHFFASKKSFVICHLTPAVYHLIKNEDLVENLKHYAHRKRSLGRCTNGGNRARANGRY